MEDIALKVGEMVKTPKSMSRQERDKWHKQVGESAREYLFSIDQPVVYKKDGVVVAEYRDGRILILE